jgi:hypothetical protein
MNLYKYKKFEQILKGMTFLEKWSKQPPEKVAKNHLINIIKLWEIWCFSGMCL